MLMNRALPWLGAGVIVVGVLAWWGIRGTQASGETDTARRPGATSVQVGASDPAPEEKEGTGTIRTMPFADPDVPAPDPEEDVLRIRVVDGSGAPQSGVPLVLGPTDEHGRVRAAARAQTGIDGTAVVRVDRVRSSGPQQVVEIELLLGEPSSAQIDLRHLPEDPVTLVLPPTGELEVELLDPQGGPCRDPASFRVSA